MGKLAEKVNPYRVSAFSLADIVVGTESGGNVVNVAIALKDSRNKAIAERVSFLAYLSTDPEGDNLASAPTSIAIGTNGLAIPLIAARALQLVTNAAGLVDINITLSSGAATYYLILVMPDGSLKQSTVITFAA